MGNIWSQHSTYMYQQFCVHQWLSLPFSDLGTRAVSKVNSQELKKSCSSVDANNFSVITTVHILCDVLSIEMEQAKRDLVHASMTAPMYGAIQSILVALEESTKMYVLALVVVLN